MVVRLPNLSRIPVQLRPDLLCTRLERIVWQDAIIDPSGGGLLGYLRAESPAGSAFLFLQRGRPFNAGLFQGGRFLQVSLTQYLTAFPTFTRAEFCAADPSLFACVSCLFYKMPTNILQPAQVTAQNIMACCAQTDQAAMFAVRRESAYSLVYCMGGEPIVLHGATDEVFPEEGTVVQRVMAAHANNPASIYYFNDIIPHPAPGAGQPLRQLFGLNAEADLLEVEEVPCLLVRMGDRTLYKYPMEKDQIVVGRGTEADLILDNLSVSRKHAVIWKNRTGVRVEDQGSVNGLIHQGNPVPAVDLSPGAEVEIGKYTIVYMVRDTGGREKKAPTAPSQDALLGTVMTGAGSRAEIEYNGTKHKMAGMFFVIGQNPNTTLQITGDGIAPAHAEVARGPQGYQLRQIDGAVPIQLNGQPLQAPAQLSNGDQFSIGPHVFVFRLGGGAAQL